MSNEPLRVRNWAANFETHESRRLKRLEWVAIPTDLQDIRYRMLVADPDGAAHFGAWIALVEVASTCKPRGTLIDGGVALTEKHLAMKTGIPESVFAAVIPRLLEMGWLEQSGETAAESPDVPAESADVPAESPGKAGKTSAYITECCRSSENVVF